MENRKPIIFLAFANEKQEESRYLRALAIEQKQLERSLEKAVQAGLCELIVKTNCELRDIWETFQRHSDRIAIFHYGGHADGYQLLLETAEGDNQIARGEGLVSFLGGQRGLKLVFLNGCSTEAQAIDLTLAGVPAVIGTANSINDSVATQLATSFYRALGAGLTLERAWKEAQDEIRTRPEGSEGLEDSSRGLRKKEAIDRFPWNLKFREGSQEVLNSWNLPDASDNPLFGLPEIPLSHHLPESPFLFLRRYERRHAEVFFGRSYYVRELFQKVVDPGGPPIILLYGQSGVGKSSLFDAGLVPRLEGALRPDGKSEYEVRYLRRIRDLGLGGTLAQGLSYTLERQEVTREEREDIAGANADTLRQIEELIDDLQGETREDFSEFLERYRSIQAYRAVEGTVERRDIEQPEVYAEGNLRSHAGEAIREAWKTIEEQSGKKLVVILDQVEELFTQPNGEIKDELGDLIAILQAVFSLPGQAPAGKLILGYRKEYNPEIEERFKVSELPRTRMFLERLRHKDLLEIFKGLTTTPRLKARYNLSVEEGLPGTIADVLLRDKENPVAPVLQILLTKLWNRATAENGAAPRFTREMYNRLQREGLAMKEFFQQQMALLETWNPEVVHSGLALDVLEKHTTTMGTSQVRHLNELRELYRHRPDVIDKLVEKFKEYYLLTEVHSETSQGEGYTALPHDTLAPIVMEEYNHSDKLGQRSFRILVTKTRDVALRDQEDVRLDDMDLGVVEEGRKGMRDLTNRERKLVELSVEERKKRLKLKQRFFQVGVITAFVVLILSGASAVLTVSALRQKQKDRILAAYHESQKHAAEGRDSLALTLANFAYLNSKSKPLDLIDHYFSMGHQALRKKSKQRAVDGQGIRSALIRPFSLSMQLPEPTNRIKSMDFDPGRGALVSSSGGRSLLLSSQGTLRDLGLGMQGEEVLFSADGKYVQSIAGKHKSPMYLLRDQLMPNPPVVKVFRRKTPPLLQPPGVRRYFDMNRNLIVEEGPSAGDSCFFNREYLEAQDESGIIHQYFSRQGGVMIEENTKEGNVLQWQAEGDVLFVNAPSLGSGELFRVNLGKKQLEPVEEGSNQQPVRLSKTSVRALESKREELRRLAATYREKIQGYDSYFLNESQEARELIGEYKLFTGQLVDVKGNPFSSLNDFLISWGYMEEGFDATDNNEWLRSLGLMSETGDTLDLNLLFSIRMVWENELLGSMYNSLRKQEESYFTSELKRLSRYLGLNFPADTLKSNVPCRKTENVRMDSVVLSLRDFQGRLVQRFTHPDAVYFIRALTDSTYATLSIDSGQVKIWLATRRDTLARWQPGSRQLMTTIRHATPVREVYFVADHSYLLAQSDNEVSLYTLDGKPHVRIPRKGLKSWRMSPDHSSLLVCSDSGMTLFHDISGQSVSYPIPEGHTLLSANFSAEKGRFTSIHAVQRKGLGRPAENWVYLWQQDEAAPLDSFYIKAEGIEDATVIETPEGRQAVAITYSPVLQDVGKYATREATFWTHKKELKRQQFPPPGEKIKSREEVDEIAALFLGFSPDRKHLVFIPDPEEIWLRDLRGGKDIRYSMAEGYSLGLGPWIFTQDFSYLIASRANSLFLWDPFPTRDKQWESEVAALELDLATKQAHNLDTLMDHVPGNTSNEKYLTLLLIFASLLYILYAVAKRLFHLVQIKDYLEIGLTLGVYLLFGLIMLGFWSERDIQVLSSLLPMVAISILVMRLPVEIRTGPKRPAYTQLALGVLLLAGLAGLWYNAGLFSGARDAVYASFLWTPLIVVSVISGMVALPVGLALRNRKRNNWKGFYNWLLLPFLLLSIVFWSFFVDNSADFPDYVLGAAISLALGILYRQGKVYLAEKRWLALIVYPLLGLLLMQKDVGTENFNSFIILTWLSSFIQGGMAYRRQQWPYAFGAIASGILLLIGHLMGSGTLLGEEAGFTIVDLLEFTLVSGILIFALRYSLNHYYANKWPRIASMAAVSAICFAGLMFGDATKSIFSFQPDTHESADYTASAPGMVNLLQADPEENLLFAAGAASEVEIFDLSTGTQVETLNLTGDVLGLGVGAHELLTATADGYGKAWGLDSMNLIFEMPHKDWVRAIAQSPDKGFYLTGSDDGTVSLWNVYTGETSTTFTHKDWVRDVTFSPDSKYILTASDDSTARLWSLRGETMQVLKHNAPVSQARFFPEGDKVYTVSDGMVSIWDLEGKLLAMKGSGEEIAAIAMNPDGKSFWVAQGSILTQIDLKGNVKQSIDHETLGEDLLGITAICLLPAKGYVVTAYGGELLVWKENGELVKRMGKEDG